MVSENKYKYEFRVNNKKYYTEFIRDIIHKKEKLEIIRSSKEIEMKYIRELRKKNKLIIRDNLCLNNIYSGKMFNNYIWYKKIKLVKLV